MSLLLLLNRSSCSSSSGHGPQRAAIELWNTCYYTYVAHCYANDFYTLCPMLGISSLKPVSFSIGKRAADCNITVIGHGCQDKGLCYYEKCIKKHLSHTTCKVYGLFLRQDVDHGFGYNSSGIGQWWRDCLGRNTSVCLACQSC